MANQSINLSSDSVTHGDPSEFYNLLKQAVDINPSTSVDTSDEQRSTVGTTSIVKNPPDRPTGTTDAPWGEPGPKDPYHNSTGAHNNSIETRQGELSRAFSGTQQAGAAQKADVSQQLSHAASGDFEAHSALLQPKGKLKVSHPRAQTLAQQVNKVIGR